MEKREYREKQQSVPLRVNYFGKGRMANLDFLGIVSMLLVTMLHFIGKSSNHPVLTQQDMAAWGHGHWRLLLL